MLQNRRPGPKLKEPSAKVVKKTVSLQPKTMAWLLEKGDGVLSRGVEMVATEDMARVKTTEKTEGV